MLNPQKRIYLAALATAYKAYTNESLPIEDKNKWFSMSQRKAIHPEMGTYLINDCYGKSLFMKEILDMLRDALCDGDGNSPIALQAQQVCIMFEELYKNDSDIKASIQDACFDSSLSIKQLDEETRLSAILSSSEVFKRPQPQVFTFEKANQEEKASKLSTRDKIANLFGM